MNNTNNNNSQNQNNLGEVITEIIETASDFLPDGSTVDAVGGVLSNVGEATIDVASAIVEALGSIS